MREEQVKEAWESIESDLEAFRFFWDMGDHVMYRNVATQILRAARILDLMVHIVEDDDDV